VLLVLDHPRGEAVPEEVPAPSVAEVEPLGVASVEALQAGREVGLRGLDDQLEVVRHQAEDLAAPTEAVDAVGEELEEGQPVVVVADDRGSVHAASRHVEEAVGQLGPQNSWHQSNVPLFLANASRREKSSRFRHACGAPFSHDPGSDPGSWPKGTRRDVGR
jgi:hypothetical protein